MSYLLTEREERYLFKVNQNEDLEEFKCCHSEIWSYLNARRTRGACELYCNNNKLEKLWVFNPSSVKQWHSIEIHGMAFRMLLEKQLERTKRKFASYVKRGSGPSVTDDDGYAIDYDDDEPMWDEDKVVFLNGRVCVKVRCDGCVCREDENTVERWLQGFAAEMGIYSYDMTNEVVRDNGADYSIAVTMKLKED